MKQAGATSSPMKTKTQPDYTDYTVGSVTFSAYEKFGPHIQPAPNGRELAELYDKAAKQIELLVHALKLCCQLTPAAQAARSAAFDAVMEDLKS
jgi:hypothetical protein